MPRKMRYSALEFLNKQYTMIKGLCKEVEIKVPKKRRQEIPDIETLLLFTIERHIMYGSR